jgi:serine protease DegQ
VALRVEREPEESALRLQGNPLRNLPPEMRREMEEYYRRPSGVASGLLLDGEGRILTSRYNVLGKLKAIEATLASGRRAPARLVAQSTLDDLALVALDGGLPAGVEALPPLEWSAAGGIETGRMVLALGCAPDAEHPTVTLGIVSAPGRNFGRALQTDAPLNYGNVGGPLVDLDGRVLGISGFVGHTWPHWGLNSGIGFATRADAIQRCLPILLSSRDVHRPLLGVTSRGGEGDDGEPGARVTSVSEGSAAAAAGIRRDDRLLELDGVALRSSGHLRVLLLDRRPGDVVRVKLRRGSEYFEVQATLGEFKEGQR